MAIQIRFNTRFGDTYEEAYTRIISLKIDYVAMRADAILGIYRSELDRKLGKDPVSIESKRYSGEQFKTMFREISIYKDDSTINPISSIYVDLTTKEGKYKDAKKLYDEKEDEYGEVKEVSKEEIIEDERKAEEERLAGILPLD